MIADGRFNLVIGGVVLLFGAVGGVVLAMTMDPSLASGQYELSSVRFFYRDGHGHGLLFAFLNLIVGLALPRLALSDRARTICGAAAAVALLLPVALLLRGITYPSAAVAPVAFVGSIGFMVAAVLIAAGAARRGKNGPSDED